VSGRPLILALPGHEILGERLADALPGERGNVLVRAFPDGESYVRLETPVVGRDVVLAVSLSPPDAQAMPLMFVARGARELGARRVLLAAPYLSYLRQDTRFQPGEVVTSAGFAEFLSALVDGIATIDPHLHRYHALAEIYRVPTRIGHAARPVAAWIADHVTRPLIVGPDRESEQWVSAVARAAAAPHVVLTKIRRGDQDVAIEVPPLDAWRDRTPVLVDDIVSTARTLIAAVRQLRAAGCPPPVCIGVHAIFAGDAHQALLRAGAAEVVTANTIRHPSNGIDLVPELAAGIVALLAE
jgi:ribose-phosphate pyrophosphokinase